MKIAVIGGGIYGVTAAIRLAGRGHQVELFEKHNDLLQVASGINQYRLHRGYHYPRSAETIISSREAEPLFRAEYSEAVVDQNDHYYAIAADKSLISGEDYLATLKCHGLEHEIVPLDLINPASVQLVIKVKESLFDPSRLRALAWQRLGKTGVKIHTNTVASLDLVSDHDYVINCTYATLNTMLAHLPESQRNYQFELCEKPVVRFPREFQKKSIVIMDGPFTCIDPVGEGLLHVIGNVVHAIHATNIGKHPEIPKVFRGVLNQGVVIKPPVTNFSKFIESAEYFMPAVKKAEYIGSMFTIRTVLPHVDKTDTRPTLVDQIDDRIINVFSGKIGNCVTAADRVVEIVENRVPASIISSLPTA